MDQKLDITDLKHRTASSWNTMRRGAEAVDLRRADLAQADLAHRDLKQANLEGANFSEATLTDADLTQACLRRANLRRAKLNGAFLVGADLREADLRGANLDDADLRGADLQGADITYASLRYVSITARTNFGKINTRSAKAITFRDAPATPIACPQDILQSICEKCGKESFGRFFGLHYGIRTEHDYREWGTGWSSFSRYRILGYREVFLCKRCIWRSCSWNSVTGIFALLLCPLLSLLSLPLFQSRLILGVFIGVGAGYLLAALIVLLGLYVFDMRGAFEDLAWSLCVDGLKEKHKEDEKGMPLVYLGSRQYTDLE